MLRFIVGLPVGMWAAAIFAAEPAIRPISQADSVLAVYREDWGRAAHGPAVIFAAWADGHVVWSGDRLSGGPPYRAGRVDPKQIAAALSRFERDGLFAADALNRPHFGPDSQFITVLVKSGKQQLKMQSWHEPFEASGSHVVDHGGASALDGRRRLDVLRSAPAEYLFFRYVWSETRASLVELIPAESTVAAGKPVLEAGVLSWQEPAP